MGSGKKKVRVGGRRQPSGGIVTSKGAAGTPVSTGSGGESVNRGHVLPGDRRCDSQVGRKSL